MKFSNALLGADADDYVPIAAAAEAAGLRLGRAVATTCCYPRSSTSKYPYTPDGKPQFSPDESVARPVGGDRGDGRGRRPRCGS